MPSKSLAWFLLIVLSLVWGSSFILMKRGMDVFSSDEVAALRLGITFIVLLPFASYYRYIRWREHWKGIVILAFAGNFVPAFLFTLAETRISSSLAGMLNSLTPFLTVIIGAFWFGTRPGGRQVAGVVAGLIAALMLVYLKDGAVTMGDFAYGGLVFIATILYAVNVNGIKKYLGGLHPLSALVWAFTLVGPPAILYLLAGTDVVTDLQSRPEAMTSLGYVAILAIGGSAIAGVLYNVLIRISGALFASSCTYLIPVVAVLWGVFDHESFSWRQGVAVAAVLASLWLIQPQPKNQS